MKWLQASLLVITGAAVDENSGAGSVIYTATADDSLDTSAGVTFSLLLIVSLRFLLTSDQVK